MYIVQKITDFSLGRFYYREVTPIKDEHLRVIKFETLEAARQFLSNRYITEQVTKQSYTVDHYMLQHGEFKKPVWKIRRIRKTK